MQLMMQSAVIKSALRPKNQTPARSAGMSAMLTVNMMRLVVSSLFTWGLTDTINCSFFVASIYALLKA
jgi:hypothetical protein